MKIDSYSVYVHTNMINGKVYVGATHKHPIEKRWRNGTGYIRNKEFYSDIQKYGWDHFEHRVVEEGLTESEASELEKHLIQLYDSTNPERGYNFEKGGLNKAEQERCEKISNSLLGENHRMYGKHQPMETREKIRQSLTGEKGYWYGKTLPEDIKKRLSQIAKDNNVGQRFQDSNVKKRKAVYCIELNKEFESLTAVEKETGINHVSVSRAIRGMQETAGGYHWQTK